MSEKALATRGTSNSVMLRMAAKFGMDPQAFERTILATVVPGGQASKEQVAAFLLVADQHNLNPLTKEIYAFPSKGGGVVPIVGYDGWLRLMNSHPQADGIELVENRDGGKLISCTAKVYRKDRAHPTVVTEYLAECIRSTEPWGKWPTRMLRNKAAIQGIRAAFGFAGIYDPDEAERIIEVDGRSKVVEQTNDNLDALTAKLEAPPADTERVDTETGEVEQPIKF